MVSISGIRGIIGESLTPEIINDYCMAYGTIHSGKKIVIGRDTRHSGEMVLNLAKGALISVGCQVIDINFATTPTIEVMIEHLKAAGGIMVSASHNPIEWNALKFFNKDGTLQTSGENDAMLKVYASRKFKLAKWNQIHSLKIDETADEKHIELILKNIDYKSIKKKNFKVALDSINGAGGVITPLFLKELNCRATLWNTDMSGKFQHKPEPLLANLKGIQNKAKKEKYDAVFVQDPDADRLVLFDEQANWLGEEYTASLCIREILKKKKSAVVVNMSTSRMNQDIANEFKCPFFRSKVGEANVIELMKKKKSIAGGEGNGGIIAGNIHYGRDSLVGIGYILEGMSKGKKLSQMHAEIPAYSMIKETVPVDKKKLKKVIETCTKKYKDETLNHEDGLRIDFKDSWVHLRSSNTEPIMRIIAEAKTSKEAKSLIETIKKEINK